ncbi:hypothetical protein ACFQ21_21600 [Ohtaekwangia kribbensis]|uniref:Uncharacterized protein n=1 Tax=Ohtaekwangia kribbensis TaxID=688913 RepID=A0ABW3K6Q3_9BACT
MQDKNLIISLIKDDLTNNKLVSGLNNLGLNASDYHLQLSETILTMMGLDTEDDSIHDLYFQLTQQSESLDLSNIGTREQQLNAMAQSIYSELSRRRSIEQHDLNKHL